MTCQPSIRTQPLLLTGESHGTPRWLCRIFLRNVGRGFLLIYAWLPVFAQTPVDSTTSEDIRWSVNADLFEFTQIDASEVTKLIGSVVALHGKTRITSSEAYGYPDRYHFTGDVLIIDEADTLSASEVVYYIEEKRGVASGGITLSDGEAVLTAPSAVYLKEDKKAEFENGVHLVDSVSTLKSRMGSYWTEEHKANFFGDVELRQDDLLLRSDTLLHLRDTSISEAVGNVRLMQWSDSTGSSRTVSYVAGEALDYDDPEGHIQVRGRPVMLRITVDSLNSDTLAVVCSELSATESDSLEEFVAWGDVQIWQTDLAAQADSIVMQSWPASGDTLTTERPEIGVYSLFGEPMAWMQESQIDGDTLIVGSVDGSPDTIRVIGSAFVAQPDSISGRIQQVQGRDLIGQFVRDTLRVITVGPNAEAIYFRSDREAGHLKDAVMMSADEIVLEFAQGEVANVRAIRGIEGRYYERDAIPGQLQLGRFKWEPDSRPDHFLMEQIIKRLDGIFQPLSIVRDESGVTEQSKDQ